MVDAIPTDGVVGNTCVDCKMEEAATVAAGGGVTAPALQAAITNTNKRKQAGLTMVSSP
jgi:hypothetical protein